MLAIRVHVLPVLTNDIAYTPVYSLPYTTPFIPLSLVSGGGAACTTTGQVQGVGWGRPAGVVFLWQNKRKRLLLVTLRAPGRSRPPLLASFSSVAALSRHSRVARGVGLKTYRKQA